eukprot:8856_1
MNKLSFRYACMLLLIISCLTNVLCIISPERFEEFKQDVTDLILDDCDPRPFDFPPPSCLFPNSRQSPGLRFGHPDVTEHDLAESALQAHNPVVAGLIRLSFHDCFGINHIKVAQGNVNEFMNSITNGAAGGCNGCIGFDNPSNNGLIQAAILPMEDICQAYKAVENGGLSRADCWALAATIAVEYGSDNVGAGQRIGLNIYPSINSSIPYFVGRQDCDNGYEEGEVEYPWSNPSGVYFDFPQAELGWYHTSSIFKSRFGWATQKTDQEYFTNRDIIALISGGHSMGRAHEKISGYSGGWDFGPEALDPQFISILHGEDFTFTRFGVKQNLNLSQRTPTSNIQWQMKQNDAIFAAFRVLQDPVFFDPIIESFAMSFNTDVSMVYDLSYWIDNKDSFGITCQTNAKSICEDGQIILTAPRGNITSLNKGKSSQELGELLECPVGGQTTCCQYIQCPIQCKGGWTVYQDIINGRWIDDEGEIKTIRQFPDNEDCPAAISKKYVGGLTPEWEIPNADLGQDFAKAFTKMITIGYVDHHKYKMQKVKLNQVVISNNAATNSNGLFGGSVASTIGIITAIIIVCLLLIMVFVYYFCCSKRKKIVITFKNMTEEINVDGNKGDRKETESKSEVIPKHTTVDSG